MRAGELKYKVVIQQITEQRNSFGEITEAWTDVAAVWAAIEPIRGREYWESQQVNAEVTGRIKIRYLEGITPKMRVKHGVRIFEIVSVIDPEERHQELQLLVSERIDG